MKKLISKNEGVWFEETIVPVSEGQINLIRSREDSDATARQELLDSLYSQRYSTPDTESLNIAQTKYDELIQSEMEGLSYSLIKCIMKIENGVARGIINLRVDNEHKQIRF